MDNNDVIKVSKSYIDELVYTKLFQAQFIQEQGLLGEFTKWCKERERDMLTFGGMIKDDDDNTH